MKFPTSLDAPFPRRVFVTLGLLAGAGSVYLLLKQGFSFLFSSAIPDKPIKFPVIGSQALAQLKTPWTYAQGLWLIQDERGWYALTNICTHLGCQPALDQTSKALVCPCHGSRFNLQGFPIKGPATRPLFRPFLWLDERKTVWADTRREVDHAFRILI
jgi:cytochrome b6-f complex iron-sulfur subunit